MREQRLMHQDTAARDDLGVPQRRDPIPSNSPSANPSQQGNTPQPSQHQTSSPNPQSSTSQSIRMHEMEKQLSYLKDMLHRHQDLLAVYQSKYQVISETEIDERRKNQQDAMTPPWIYNSDYMTPILVAYDQRLFELEQENNSYRKRFESMRVDMQRVTQENDELNQQLQDELERKLKEAQRISNIGEMQTAHDNDEWNDLREKLDTQSAENEALERERDALHQEVERLKRTIQDINHRFEAVASAEDRTKTILQNARQKIRVAQEDRDDMKQQVLAAQRRITQLSKQLAETNAKLSTSGMSDDHQVRKKELEISQLEDQLQVCRNELDALTREKQVLLRQNGEAEERVARHQQHEFVALQRVKDLTDQLDATTLDLNTLKQSEANKRQEIQNLEQKIQQLQRENTEKERQVKEELQTQFSAERTRLQDDVSRLQVTRIQLEEQIKRAEREKIHAEQEVQRIIRAAESEHITPPKLVSDLTRKLAIASNERDEAERMYEQLRNSTKRQHTQWEQDREHLTAQAQQYQKRMQHAERQLAQTTDELEQSKRDLANVERQLQDVQYERDEMERQHQNRYNELKQDHSRQLGDVKRRLKQCQERLEHTEQELQATKIKLEKQESAAKTELRADLDAIEQKYHDVKTDNSRLREQVQSLENKIAQLHRERTLLVNDKEALEESDRKLSTQLKQIRKRADACATQIKSLLQRESDLLKEKTNIQLVADRMELEVERSKRERDNLKKKYADLRNDYDKLLEIQGIFNGVQGGGNAGGGTDASSSMSGAGDISWLQSRV